MFYRDYILISMVFLLFDPIILMLISQTGRNNIDLTTKMSIHKFGIINLIIVTIQKILLISVYYIDKT